MSEKTPNFEKENPGQKKEINLEKAEIEPEIEIETQSEKSKIESWRTEEVRSLGNKRKIRER